MKNKRLTLLCNSCAALFLLFALGTTSVIAQSKIPIRTSLLQNDWPANWIAHPAAKLKQYEVYHFRKQFIISAAPSSFIIHISADSRYKLFVNGKQVGLGPARSDLDHWPFDTYDLAPFLIQGNNVLAVVVWNFGEYNPYAQHSYRTALIMQGNDAASDIVNTDKSWLVYKNESYSPVAFQHNDQRLLWQYYVAGMPDSVSGKLYPWNWENPNFDDSNWQHAVALVSGCPDGPANGGFHTLVPRTIPGMEMTTMRFAKVAQANGVTIPAGFPAQIQSFTIPAHSSVSVLLDNKILSCGYPSLLVNGGASTQIKIYYAEALVFPDKTHPGKWHKYDRDSIQGAGLFGVYDVFVPDGGQRRFTPLWARTFRYVQLQIETKDEPLTISDINYLFVAYPYAHEGHFTTDLPIHAAIDSVAFHTARLCAWETYMDCPYYEQLQYLGDTRLQAFYWYHFSSDDRLTRNAISQFCWSQKPGGLTMSRYPSDLPQYSPIFSLCWLLMVKDYYMYRNDPAFVSSFVPNMFRVLEWFDGQINSKGLLSKLPYLDFLDSHYNNEEVLRGSKDQTLAASCLFYVYTVQQLSPLFREFGQGARAAHYDSLAQRMKEKIISNCFDAKRGLFADNADKKIFSQHTNLLAALTGCVAAKDQRTFMHKVLEDSSLTSCATYFKFYLFQALRQVGMEAEILSHLDDWRYMLAQHTSTFTEWKIDPRSDCHAWSAYPPAVFLQSIAGISPAAPGFRKINIAPHPGTLKEIHAAMPHPLGSIKLDAMLSNGHWTMQIVVPKGTVATLNWQNKTYNLQAGVENKFNLPE